MEEWQSQSSGTAASCMSTEARKAKVTGVPNSQLHPSLARALLRPAATAQPLYRTGGKMEGGQDELSAAETQLNTTNSDSSASPKRTAASQFNDEHRFGS